MTGSLRLLAFAVLLASPPVVGEDLFPDWDALDRAPGSRLFRARVSNMNRDRGYINNHPWLSEELLFIQSNARTLVCQNPRGELRHLAIPTRVYPVPTGTLGYGPGMYYHFDSVTADHISYRLRLDGEPASQPLVDEAESNESFYAHDFLPLTLARRSGLRVAVTSFAPVAADSSQAPLSPAPLPGLASAFYVARLENTGTTPLRGVVELVAPDDAHGRTPETSIRRDALVMTVSDGTVALRMTSGEWTEKDGRWFATRTLELAPGEATTVESVVALAGDPAGVMPIVYAAHMRSALEWLNLTARFWQQRLGRLSVDGPGLGDEADVSRDLYVRCVMDNFCCLQTDDRGMLISHYQGAPKPGTIWGIDYEPTIVSILPIAPELARQGLLFTLDRNRAPRSEYGKEHSVPILVSPVIIARKYLEATGDTALLEERPEVMTSLESVFADLASLEATSHRLYPSRYSSDGPVGRRYDHGTNVKAWFAFDSFRYILEALGRPQQADAYREAAAEIRDAISKTMVVEGPFGPQISGGTNLGEDAGGFYLPDDVLYYDGEDTGSHLAPVYGVQEFASEPWVNYHRFARSLFSPTWEPEFGTVRWFPSWSMPVLDGTGFFSVLGGSVTREEMARALRRLHEYATDPTGSVFWWPVSLDFKQGLSRCSQGQGSWAWQYLEQWLGLRVDALSRVLTVAPRGLLSAFDWQGFRAGPQVFDIRWREAEDEARLTVRNRGAEKWTVRFGARPFGTGADGTLEWRSRLVGNGEREVIRVAMECNRRAAAPPRDVVAETEAARLGEGGIVFRRYGPLDPFPEWYELWPDTPLDLRFYLLNASEEGWKSARVRLTYPEGWRARGRPPRSWPRPTDLRPREATIELGAVPTGVSRTAAFQLRGPNRYDTDELTKGLSPHTPAEAGPTVRLPTSEVDTRSETRFEAILSATTTRGERVVRRLTVPVEILPIAAGGAGRPGGR